MNVVTGALLALAFTLPQAASAAPAPESAPPPTPAATPAPAPAATPAPAPAAAPAPAPAPETTQPPAAPAGSIAQAQFTTAVRNREPVDDLHTLTHPVTRLYFFTDLRDMSGGMVIHRWIHAGHVMASVPFQIHGPRWRVWSSKRLLPQWTGKWTVQVLNGAGKVLDEATLRYEPDAATKAGHAPAAAPAHAPSVQPVTPTPAQAPAPAPAAPPSAP